jgi:hypothetical protein
MFEYEGAKISARTLTIGDDETIAVLQGRLTIGTRLYSAVQYFEFVLGAQIDGDSPVPLVTEASSEAEVMAGLEAWKALPRRFLNQWRAEIARMESAGKNE